MPSYALPADMINCFDQQILGDVCSDNGIPVSPTDLLNDPKMLSALSRASGEVEAALLDGGMYQIADLASLADNAQALLVDTVCCVAMCRLLKRRVSKGTEELLKGVCDDAREQLRALRKGEAVFGNTTNAEQGQLPETTGITTIDVQNLNMIRDRTRNYYPLRDLPYGR